MITSIISGAAKDLLVLVDGGVFFEEAEKTRLARINRVLTPAYPKSLREYMAEVSAAHFVGDMKSVMSVLATDSVIAHGREARKNKFLIACAWALKEAWASGESAEQTELGGVLKRVLGERGTARAARATERELQQFVELVLKEDSPQVQIAILEENLPYGKFQTWYGGIPSFRVNKQLLGGSRLFMKGKLVDMSWHAKVQSFLSALK